MTVTCSPSREVKLVNLSYFNQDQVHLTNCFKSLLLRGLMTVSKIHLFCSKLPKNIKIDPPSFSLKNEFLYQERDKNKIYAKITLSFPCLILNLSRGNVLHGQSPSKEQIMPGPLRVLRCSM